MAGVRVHGFRLGAGGEGWRARFAAWWRRTLVGKIWVQGAELELMRRSMAFATLGLVTLVPLLVVVAALDPFPQGGFGQWIADGMGIPSSTATPVLRLFIGRAAGGQADALSLALLVAFGVAFVTDVQLTFQMVWGLSAPPWHQRWRKAVWLAALTCYVAFEVESGVVLRHGPYEAAVRIVLGVVVGLFFFWWGQYFLLAARIRWKALFPGAVATVIGLSGLRAFSTLVFDPTISSSARAYGVVGVVLVVVSWLIGLGFVLYGGPLVGRYFYEHRTAARIERELASSPSPEA